MNKRIQYRDIMKAQPRIGNLALGQRIAYVDGSNGSGNGDMTYEEYLANGCEVKCCPPPTPKVQRVVYGGFKSKCIKGCDSETLVATVNAQAQLIGIFFDPSIASSLLITDIRFGRWPALANCEAISAAVFACCDMENNNFVSAVMAANTEICMTVKNRRKHPVEVEGVTFKALICEPC